MQINFAVIALIRQTSNNGCRYQVTTDRHGRHMAERIKNGGADIQFGDATHAETYTISGWTTNLHVGRPEYTEVLMLNDEELSQLLTEGTL